MQKLNHSIIHRYGEMTPINTGMVGVKLDLFYHFSDPYTLESGMLIYFTVLKIDILTIKNQANLSWKSEDEFECYRTWPEDDNKCDEPTFFKMHEFFFVSVHPFYGHGLWKQWSIFVMDLVNYDSLFKRLSCTRFAWTFPYILVPFLVPACIMYI